MAASSNPTYPELAAIYAQKWDSFSALRSAMIQNGIVEHGLSPYDVIQRAIDDVTTDYLLLRNHIAKATEGQSLIKQVSHPLYDHMEHLRECMVRYSTFAAQYNLEMKKARLSETRVAVLANTLRTVLEQLNIPQDTIRQVPALLIEQLTSDSDAQQINPQKAEALAEILHYNTDVEIIDETPHPDDETPRPRPQPQPKLHLPPETPKRKTRRRKARGDEAEAHLHEVDNNSNSGHTSPDD